MMRNYATPEGRAKAREKAIAYMAGWPGATLTEEDMLYRIMAETRWSGFPVLREVDLKGNRFGVVLNDNCAVVSMAVAWRAA